MTLNYNLKPLQENEIAGQLTINTIIKHLQGMRSLSEFMSITPNGQGSVNFDLDVKSIIDVILGMVKDTQELEFDFKGSISNGNLHVSSGKVYFPNTSVSVSGGTFDDDDTVHIALTGSASGSISGSLATGSVSRVITNATTMLLPLMTTATINGEKVVKYYHVGDYVFDMLPPAWINGFDATVTQSLDHVAGSNDLIWNTYSDCEQ